MSSCEEFLRDEGFASAVLWVLRDNPRARAFYEKAGWHATGEESTVHAIRAARLFAPSGELRRHPVCSKAVTQVRARVRSICLYGVAAQFDVVPRHLDAGRARRERDSGTTYTGRVRRSFDGAGSYIAWFTNGLLDNPDRSHPAYRRFRSDGQVKYEMFYERGQLQDPTDRERGRSRILRQRPAALRGALPRRQAQRRRERQPGRVEVAGGWHFAPSASLPQRQAGQRPTLKEVRQPGVWSNDAPSGSGARCSCRCADRAGRGVGSCSYLDNAQSQSRSAAC